MEKNCTQSEYQQLLEIKFGILKVPHRFRSASRYLIEAIRVEDDGSLICTSADAIPRTRHKRNATLTFIHKYSGTYIIANGSFDRIEGSNDGCTLLIKLKDLKCFEKKTVSRFTSFLQRIDPSKAAGFATSYYPEKRVA